MDRIVVVDVGCRWGFADNFINESDNFTVYGFDPDKNECDRLNNLYNSKYVSAIPLALSSTSSKKKLFLTKDPACSSLYQPDPYLTSCYPAFHCEVEVGQLEVETTTLDLWAIGNGIKYIDYLKIDTQGSELDILKGGEQLLKNIRAIQVEVEFNPMYTGQPLFYQVDEYLRHHDFLLWKFNEITHYSKNKFAGNPIHTCDVRYDEYHSETHKVFSGQLFWANAFYVNRSVLSANDSLDGNEKNSILFAAIGMPDVLGVDAEWSESTIRAIDNNRKNAESLDLPRLQAEAKAQQAEAKAEAAEAKAEAAEDLAKSILQSRSWKITAPLRVLGRRARQIKRGFILLRTDKKMFIKKVLIKVTKRVRKIKGISYLIKLVLKPFPAIKRRLKQITEISPEVHEKNLNNLSPRAKKIYEELTAAIEQHNRRGK